MNPDGSAVVGIDIGGANLKYASDRGEAIWVDFPLWRRPFELAGQLTADLARLRASGSVVAVMTGELADCFLDRSEGVRQIVMQLDRAVRDAGLAPPLYYGVDGRFHASADAVRQTDVIAAANWHALGNYVASQLEPDGLLVDIGSTTTDLIPLAAGTVATPSRTDFDRLAAGELVYIGGGRTPVCSLVSEFDFDGQMIPVMRELFATMDDVRILLDFVSDIHPDDHPMTADGKPRDKFHAANRMARMIGLDHRSVSIESALRLARQVHEAARARISAAARRFDASAPLILSGHATDLSEHLAPSRRVVPLSQRLHEGLSRVAPAYAVAMLFRRSLVAG